MEEHFHDMDYVINLIFPNVNESGYVKSFIIILNEYIKLFNNASDEDVKIYTINKLYGILYTNTDS